MAFVAILGRRHTGEYSATFANEETWFELIGAELLVEHSQAAGGFAEATSTELCKGNTES